jgi:hypothetical protein
VLLQIRHERESAELPERAVLGLGACFQRALERGRHAKADRVVFVHEEHC